MSDETSPRKGGAVTKAEPVEAPRMPKRPTASLADDEDESPELTDEQRDELKKKLEAAGAKVEIK